MSIYDHEVAQLIQKTIYLQILRATLEWDRLRMRQLKMFVAYNELIDKVILSISNDLFDLKKQLRAKNAKIVVDDQQDKKRYVKYIHNDYAFETEYLNHNIKVACEMMLRQYFWI
ncbi:hypothetical protein [Seinonella peptonophila]|nr:hypothetical protein [Seinonella peptonophila]